MASTPQAVSNSKSKEKPPPDTIRLNGSEVIGGLTMDEEVELTVKARLVEEGSRDYEGEKEKTQRFQISSIAKAGSKAFNSAARAQNIGGGIK